MVGSFPEYLFELPHGFGVIAGEGLGFRQNLLVEGFD